jgi:hypothetical protein
MRTISERTEGRTAQAPQDFKTWTFIGAATLGASGSVPLTGVNAGSFPKRFYRRRG